MTAEERYLEKVDIEYSYRLAKTMEQFKSNPKLGFRTAGSRAEYETGEFIRKEMEALGLSDVRKDPVTVDSWEFEKAVLSFVDESGDEKVFQLGAYQTRFETRGPETFTLVYAGRGTQKDYKDLDVKGKLVLVEINQRDEWWINFPVYQAYLKGAAGLIAAQAGGYGEVDKEALNTQDIAGPEYAPAFSISRNGAEALKEAMEGKGEIQVSLDAVSKVERGRTTYNIVGSIPGFCRDRMILLSAHYDSYYDGFQDDNTAVSMMLGIAKGLLSSGYRPENTLVFCAMAAEEWGVCDSKYDWSTGAYEQVFTLHPDWQGKVIADLNFELPALAHGMGDAIRSTYEYEDFLEHFIRRLPALTEAYSDEFRILTPIETWSDDFSMAIAGIPSMVNDFSGGSFMETHYHSQFDNDVYYDEKVYRFHHELYGCLAIAFDRLAVVPMDFGNVFFHCEEALDLELCWQTGARGETLSDALSRAGGEADAVYRKLKEWNKKAGALFEKGEKEEARKIREMLAPVEKKLLELFKREQNHFVRLDWHDEVLFPFEAAQNNLWNLEKAIRQLKGKKGAAALEAIYEIDNNRYAFRFDQEVYLHFTEYVLNQPKERLKWGGGRIVHHENLYPVVRSLMDKIREEQEEYSWEIQFLEDAKNRQSHFYREDMEYMITAVEEMTNILAGIRASI